MRRFLVLLKKEIRELLTIQLILPLLISGGMLFFIGNIISAEQEKSAKPQEVYIIDQDRTATSAMIIKSLENANLKPEIYRGDVQSALEEARGSKKKAVFVIPGNFERQLATAPKKLLHYSVITSFSLMGSQSYAGILQAVAIANSDLSTALINQTPSGSIDPAILKNPLSTEEFVVVNGKQAGATLAQVMGFVAQQSMFIPIILFIVIMLSSQMIATAIASEKENKTLETLLTTPVNRNAIVIAKMVAAGLVSLLASLVYMFGYRSYLSSAMGQAGSGDAVAGAISQLGLAFNPADYLLLGLSLFVGILVALAIALIIGAFAEDVKSVAGLITPLMILIVIPYLFSLFSDINTLPAGLKFLASAIPFTHVFTASANLFLDNYAAVIWGILYQIIWFIVFVLIAAKIFSSDKIVTLKLNFSRKK